MKPFIALMLLMLAWASPTYAVNYDTEFNRIESRYKEIEPLIIKYAAKHGVEPELVATVAYKESRFNARAKNPRSSAAGVMQLTKPTARRLLAQYGPALGLPKNANIRSARVNLELGTVYLQEVKEVLKLKLKRTPTHSEIYLGFKYSPERAAKMIRGHRAKMVDFYQTAATANASDYWHQGRALTVSETRRSIAKQYNRAAAFYSPKIKQSIVTARANRILELYKAEVLSWKTKDLLKEIPRVLETVAVITPHYTASVQAADIDSPLTSGRTYKGVPL